MLDENVYKFIEACEAFITASALNYKFLDKKYWTRLTLCVELRKAMRILIEKENDLNPFDSVLWSLDKTNLSNSEHGKKIVEITNQLLTVEQEEEVTDEVSIQALQNEILLKEAVEKVYALILSFIGFFQAPTYDAQYKTNVFKKFIGSKEEIREAYAHLRAIFFQQLSLEDIRQFYSLVSRVIVYRIVNIAYEPNDQTQKQDLFKFLNDHVAFVQTLLANEDKIRYLGMQYNYFHESTEVLAFLKDSAAYKYIDDAMGLGLTLPANEDVKSEAETIQYYYFERCQTLILNQALLAMKVEKRITEEHWWELMRIFDSRESIEEKKSKFIAFISAHPNFMRFWYQVLKLRITADFILYKAETERLNKGMPTLFTIWKTGTKIPFGQRQLQDDFGIKP